LRTSQPVVSLAWEQSLNMSHIIKPVFSYLMFAVDLVKVQCALRSALHGAGSDQPLSFLRVALFCCCAIPPGTLSFVKRPRGKGSIAHAQHRSSKAEQQWDAGPMQLGGFPYHNVCLLLAYCPCPSCNRRVYWNM
jgi:hypothetical protein